MPFSPLPPMPCCQSHSHDLVRHWVQECAKSAGELQPSSQVPVQPVCRRREQRAWGGFLVGGQHSGMERRHGREGVPWSPPSPLSARTHTPVSAAMVKRAAVVAGAAVLVQNHVTTNMGTMNTRLMVSRFGRFRKGLTVPVDLLRRPSSAVRR